MDNNDYKAIAVETAIFVLMTTAIESLRPIAEYLMEPDVAVEEKKTLKQNAEILRTNFTK